MNRYDTEIVVKAAHQALWANWAEWGADDPAELADLFRRKEDSEIVVTAAWDILKELMPNGAEVMDFIDGLPSDMNMKIATLPVYGARGSYSILNAYAVQALCLLILDVLEGSIGFEHEGTNIINPWMDETGRGSCDPHKVYGKAFQDYLDKFELQLST